MRKVAFRALKMRLDDVRVLKSTLRTFKYCLGLSSSMANGTNHWADSEADQRQFSLAETVIERAAFYRDRLSGISSCNKEDASQINRLSQDYYILQITLVRYPCL